MADLKRRLETAHRALETFEELALVADPIVRDAAIQRFEYTFEAVWKAAQAVLRERYGVALASPKPVIRACLENGLLNEEEAHLALAMVDHRNLTAHTYNVALAEEIFAALPAYRKLLRALSRLQT
ncbi:HI0074 family nucleotidyltransferase substrate-binding subunit [Methylothermus subterraneus]